MPSCTPAGRGWGTVSTKMFRPWEFVAMVDALGENTVEE